MFISSGCLARINNCIFINNNANTRGGAIENLGSPIFYNCIFANNSTGSDGGAIHNDNSSSTYTNCLFYGNRADGHGGAMEIEDNSSISIINGTFVKNVSNSDGIGADKGPDLRTNSSSTTVVTNSILRSGTSGPLSATYSNIRGGASGIGNINTDPIFVDADNDDYRLSACSPSVDTGTAAGAPSEDLDGNTRPTGGGIDMGAFEFQGAECPKPIPTLSEWGILILALLLMICGTLYLVQVNSPIVSKES